MLMRTKSGICIDVECFVNCKFGYDINCEVVCEDGALKMGTPMAPSIRKNAQCSTEITTDCFVLFKDAYDAEIQNWVDCAEKGVVVFNTPGANANGVKELVLAGMLLGARDVVGGIDWCKEQKDNENISKDMEKAKKKFAGHEIRGKSLVLSDWAPSAQRLQTQLQRLAWKYTAMTRLFCQSSVDAFQRRKAHHIC